MVAGAVVGCCWSAVGRGGAGPPAGLAGGLGRGFPDVVARNRKASKRQKTSGDLRRMDMLASDRGVSKELRAV